LPFRDFTVVGVVPDPRRLGNSRTFGAGVYLPIAPETAGTSLVLRVHGDPDQSRRQLIERLTKVDSAMGEIMTVRTLTGALLYVLQAAFWVTVVLGGLALALTLSGLFSVLSYLVEQRSREIGVRIALGATTQNIGGLVLSQSVRPVVFGLVAGTGLAVSLAKVLVATTVVSPAGGIVHVLDPVAYGVSLTVIVAACAFAGAFPALRAARIDPIATLRND
jgi:ABC-type lipoprotein release transport system permease subunit